MIGKRIISIHHFKRLVGTEEREALYVDYGLAVSHCFVYYDANKNLIAIMSRSCYHKMPSKFDNYASLDCYDMMKKHMDTHKYIYILHAAKAHDSEPVLNGNIVLMPRNFTENYEKFVTDNRKFLSSILSGAIHHDVLMYLYSMTNDSRNLFLWAGNLIIKRGMRLSIIRTLLSWDERYGYMSKNLKKGSITAYTGGRDSIMELMAEMYQLRREKRMASVVNTFNTVQKKKLKEYKFTKDDYVAMSIFSRLSLKKRQNFIRKMSTVEDPAEIMRNMSVLTSITFPWNKKEFIDYITNDDSMKYKIVAEGENFILLVVEDFDTVKKLGKNTNWCISKNKSYWNRYSDSSTAGSDVRQFMLFDFSKKEDDDFSVVGFTSMFDAGITYAHNFINRSILSNGQSCMPDNVSLHSCIAAEMSKPRDIIGILKSHGIPLSKVMSFEKSLFAWNRESVMAFLGRIFADDEYEILSDKGDKFAFVTESPNVAYFLGRRFMEKNDKNTWGWKKIVFVDLTVEEDSPERLMYAQIYFNVESFEEQLDCFYSANETPTSITFKEALKEYGINENIICRCVTKLDVFKDAFKSYDIATSDEMLNDDEVRKWLCVEASTHVDNGWVMRTIIESVTYYQSFDYIDMLHRHGLTVEDYLTKNGVNEFVERMIVWLIHRYGPAFDESPVSMGAYTSFLNGERIGDVEVAKKCVLIKALSIMMDTAKTKCLHEEILIRIVSNGYARRGTINVLVTEVLKRLKSWDEISDSCFKVLISYAANECDMGWLIKDVKERIPESKEKLRIMSEHGVMAKSAAN